jgi:hypothetical protein
MSDVGRFELLLEPYGPEPELVPFADAGDW